MPETTSLSGASLPAGRVGQALAVLLLLLVGAVGWVTVAAPLTDLYAERAETLAQQQALARRMATVAAGLPALRRMASEGADGGPASTTLLAGAGDAVAGATLQQMVQDMAARAGAGLKSAEALPAEAVGRNRQVAVRVSATATLPALARLLRLLGDATPALLVDDVRLRSTRTVGGGEEPTLEITLTVTGLRLSGRT